MGKQVIRLYRSKGGGPIIEPQVVPKSNRSGSKKEPLVVEMEPQWTENQAAVARKSGHGGSKTRPLRCRKYASMRQPYAGDAYRLHTNKNVKMHTLKNL